MNTDILRDLGFSILLLLWGTMSLWMLTIPIETDWITDLFSALVGVLYTVGGTIGLVLTIQRIVERGM